MLPEENNHLNFDLLTDKFDKATLFPAPESDMTKIDLDHLSKKHQLEIKKLIEAYPDSYAKNSQNHGHFNLFKISLNFMAGHTAIQPRRTMDYDRVSK